MIDDTYHVLALQVEVLFDVECTDGDAQVAVGKVDALLPSGRHCLRAVLVTIVLFYRGLESRVQVVRSVHHKPPNQIVFYNPETNNTEVDTVHRHSTTNL